MFFKNLYTSNISTFYYYCVIILVGDFMSDRREAIKTFIIVFLVLIIVCSGLFFVSGNQDNVKDNLEVYDIESIAIKESSDISDDEKRDFIEIGVDKYLEYYGGDIDTLVLVARPTCHYCQIAEPIIQNVMYKYDLDINYLNTDDIETDDQAKLIESNEYFKRFGTPSLLVVSSGEIKDSLDGLTTLQNYIKFLEKNNFIN